MVTTSTAIPSSVRWVGAQILAAQNGIWRSDGTKAGTKKIFSEDTGHCWNFRLQATPSISTMTRSSGKATERPPAPSNCNPTCGWPPITSRSTNARLFRGTRKDGSTFTDGFWETDGTGPAVKLLTLTDLFVDSGLTPINFNGLVYFFKRDDLYSRSLWKTDGTPGGTVMVKTGFGNLNTLAIAGGKLFILSYRAEFGPMPN